MRFRLWPRRQAPEPAEDVAVEAPVEPPAEPEPEPEPEPEREPEPEPEPQPEPEPEPEPVVQAAPSPAEPEAPQVPTILALTIDEAKATIRSAGGDVIQVGFLASAYRRHLEEDPRSSETAAARKRLSDLIAQRLKDRDLLAPKGTVELRD